jgi:hypothetical protein
MVVQNRSTTQRQNRRFPFFIFGRGDEHIQNQAPERVGGLVDSTQMRDESEEWISRWHDFNGTLHHPSS